MPPTTTELADVQRALEQLRARLAELRTRYGDLAAVRRIANDVERLDIDLADVPGELPAPRRDAQPTRGDTVLVPATPYDPSLWHGADDEGLGGQQPRER